MIPGFTRLSLGLLLHLVTVDLLSMKPKRKWSLHLGCLSMMYERICIPPDPCFCEVSEILSLYLSVHGATASSYGDNMNMCLYLLFYCLCVADGLESLSAPANRLFVSMFLTDASFRRLCFSSNNAENLSKYTTAVLFSLHCLAVKLANSLCFHLKCPLLEMRDINHCTCLAPTCPLCHISLNFLQHGRKAAGPLTLSSLGATVSQPLISIFNELSAMI